VVVLVVVVVVFDADGALADVEVLDDVLEPPHPATANATTGTMRSTASLLTRTPFLRHGRRWP
jgi:hypothetical protein